MNIAKRTSLSLLLAVLGAVPANAALTGESGPDDVSIESAGRGNASQPLDLLLGGGNHSDLFKSVLKQHASSAQAAASLMDGHFGTSGAEQPVLLDQRGPAGQIIQFSSSAMQQAVAPELSLTATVNQRVSAEGGVAQAPVTSPTANAAGNTYAPNNNQTEPVPGPVVSPSNDPVTPVPLPTSGPLIVSGLLGLAGIRRLRQQPE
jgi:hypothetical protein